MTDTVVSNILFVIIAIIVLSCFVIVISSVYTFFSEFLLEPTVMCCKDMNSTIGACTRPPYFFNKNLKKRCGVE